MGEVDTKPIESVQAALSLFGEKNDQRRHRSVGNESKKGSEKEEWDLMLADLANYKMQLEVKGYAYEQALLKIESYHTTIHKLYSQLKNCEAERDQFIVNYRDSRTRVEKLEFRLKELSDLLLEAGNAKEQFDQTVNELRATRVELQNVKAELASSEESKVSATRQVELVETAIKSEKEKTEELLRHVSELKEAVFPPKLVAIEARKENCKISSEKEDKVQMDTAKAQEQLGKMKEQMEMMQELESQLLCKTVLHDYFQFELMHAKELHGLSDQAESKATSTSNQLNSELELVQTEKSDQESHTKSTDTELKPFQSELENANCKLIHLNHEIDTLTREIQKMKNELDEISRRESEGQVEIALLRAEIHKGRSRIAAAEAAEAFANSVKSGLYLAAKHLAIEADLAKKETKMLKTEACNGETEADTGSVTFLSQIEKVGDAEAESGNFTSADLQISEYMQDPELADIEDSLTQVDVKQNDTDTQSRSSIEEHESLIQETLNVDLVQLPPPELESGLLEPEDVSELHVLKKDLETAKLEIKELRSVAQQAVNKAEMAERAKAAIEDQLRKWRAHKQKRREASLAALREDLVPKERKPPRSNPFKYDSMPTPYQPLGKVLNMKFVGSP